MIGSDKIETHSSSLHTDAENQDIQQGTQEGDNVRKANASRSI
jgi:hypothetical protein